MGTIVPFIGVENVQKLLGNENDRKRRQLDNYIKYVSHFYA